LGSPREAERNEMNDRIRESEREDEERMLKKERMRKLKEVMSH
tara:strand:+ start:1264 stop:1392 length:129 start_codon:yes stop_codon:yes gene_type:complete